MEMSLPIILIIVIAAVPLVYILIIYLVWLCQKPDEEWAVANLQVTEGQPVWAFHEGKQKYVPATVEKVVGRLAGNGLIEDFQVSALYDNDPESCYSHVQSMWTPAASSDRVTSSSEQFHTHSHFGFPVKRRPYLFMWKKMVGSCGLLHVEVPKILIDYHDNSLSKRSMELVTSSFVARSAKQAQIDPMKSGSARTPRGDAVFSTFS